MSRNRTRRSFPARESPPLQRPSRMPSIIDEDPDKTTPQVTAPLPAGHGRHTRLRRGPLRATGIARRQRYRHPAPSPKNDPGGSTWLAETRRWLRHAGNSSDFLARTLPCPFYPFFPFKFLILIGRFVTLEE